MKASKVLMSRAVHFETTDVPEYPPSVPKEALVVAAQYLVRTPEWVELDVGIKFGVYSNSVETRRRIAVACRKAAELAESEGN